jgi:hypothetical protein
MKPVANPSQNRWRECAIVAVGLIGLFQMAGDLVGFRAMKGVGACLVMSPFPKVFSDVNGLETFASDFKLAYRLADGSEQSLPITAELYQRLGGPYNRRNVYGAALSYAPRMPESLWQSVFCYGLKPGGVLRREFEIPDDATDVRVLIATRTRGRSDTWILQPDCAR